MTDEIITASSIMQQYFNNTFNNNSFELPNVWKKVVSNIGKNYKKEEDEITLGEKLANNSKVIDLKNGVLLVEANHPGCVQYLKMYQKFILNGLKKSVPDLNIKNLAFRIAGTSVSLSESYEYSLKKEQELMSKKIEEQEKELNKVLKQPESKRNSQLPQDLLDKFKSIEESMLTNSANK